MPKRSFTSSARSIWSGTISFGLVNIPVDLYAAVRGRATAMRMVDDQGRPLGREYYCPKDDKKLSSDDLVRGYETDDGKLVVITDAELGSVAPEKSRDINLVRFVPLEEIPAIFFNRPYYLLPSGRSAKAYHLLAETIARSKKVAVGSFVMRDHEYLVAIIADGGILRAETLRYTDEIRTPDKVGLPKPAKASAKHVKAFERAIAALTEKELDLDELSDWYAEQIQQLAQRKYKKGDDVVDVEGETETDAAEAGAEVVDLMKLIRASLSKKATLQVAADRKNKKAA